MVADNGFPSGRSLGPADVIERPGSMLRPEAIAQTYRHPIEQGRSAWSNEIAVRPWVENF